MRLELGLIVCLRWLGLWRRVDLLARWYYFVDCVVNLRYDLAIDLYCFNCVDYSGVALLEGC